MPFLSNILLDINFFIVFEMGFPLKLWEDNKMCTLQKLTFPHPFVTYIAQLGKCCIPRGPINTDLSYDILLVVLLLQLSNHNILQLYIRSSWLVQIRILFFHRHLTELIQVFCPVTQYLILPKLVYTIHSLATGERKPTPTKYDILSEHFIGRQLKFALCKMIFSSFTWFLKFHFLPMRLKFQSIKLFVFTTVNGPILHC